MKIEISDQDLQVVSEALMDVPYRYSAPVIARINDAIRAAREEVIAEQSDNITD